MILKYGTISVTKRYVPPLPGWPVALAQAQP
eukprot:COSAG02_NODE_66087_length_256_cov_0.859873_2_plen_30_part_01